MEQLIYRRIEPVWAFAVRIRQKGPFLPYDTYPSGHTSLKRWINVESTSFQSCVPAGMVQYMLRKCRVAQFGRGVLSWTFSKHCNGTATRAYIFGRVRSAMTQSSLLSDAVWSEMFLSIRRSHWSKLHGIARWSEFPLGAHIWRNIFSHCVTIRTQDPGWTKQTWFFV